MEEDDEVLFKGSALYDYLCNEGYNNFASIDNDPKSSVQLYEKQDNMKTTALAPKWISDHLHIILKCGLVLGDHCDFVEHFLPRQTGQEPTHYTLAFCGFSWAISIGSIFHISRHTISNQYSTVLCIFSSVAATYLTKKILDVRLHSWSFRKLRLMLAGLEELLIQFKRMISLVHRNELIAQSFSLHSEMAELRMCAWKTLNTSIKDMSEFHTGIKEVPLNEDVDVILHPFSSEDIPDHFDENQLSVESLKKLYNAYILIQSEFLRRLALCYCPEMWCTDTLKKLVLYSKKHFDKIDKWSRKLCSNLVQKYKLFRAISGGRDKPNRLRMPVPVAGWDFSDLYVAVRSASLHFQSLLIQNQDIEDLLESTGSINLKENKEILNGIVQILTGIQKEFRSCQACLDDSLLQALKMVGNCEEIKKMTPPESVPFPDTSTEPLPDSEMNPPTEDEVFELIVPFEGVDDNISEDDFDEMFEDRERRTQERNASKRVLQELKVVLVKKADEWRERERKAMESKGMVPSFAEQVKSVDEDQQSSVPTPPDDVNEMLTDDQTLWPLPRLKGIIPTHRSTADRSRRPLLEAQLQPSDLRKARAEELEEASQHLQPKVGFEAALLAEAMQKSKKMNFFKTEDIFLDSGDDDDTC